MGWAIGETITSNFMTKPSVSKALDIKTALTWAKSPETTSNIGSFVTDKWETLKQSLALSFVNPVSTSTMKQPEVGEIPMQKNKRETMLLQPEIYSPNSKSGKPSVVRIVDSAIKK